MKPVDIPSREARLVAVAKDMLISIAGVCGCAARDLRPGQALAADLGIDDPELDALVDCLGRIGRRMSDAPPAHPIERDELRDLQVWEVCSLQIERSSGIHTTQQQMLLLISNAQSELRGESP